ncbi:MAG TPA: hypothetical protein VIH90_03910 [Candidatus Saccharimonadales bacterium]
MDAVIRERNRRELLSIIVTEELPTAIVSAPRGADVTEEVFMQTRSASIAEEQLQLADDEQTYSLPEGTERTESIIPDLATAIVEIETIGESEDGFIEPEEHGLSILGAVDKVEHDEDFSLLELGNDPEEETVTIDTEVRGVQPLSPEEVDYQERQVELVLEALIEAFELDLETLNPDELIETREILESLLSDIQVIIDNPGFEIESYFESEEFTNVCIELLEKLHIDYDEETVQQLVLLIIKKIEIGQIEDDNLLSIDILNRLGTWEYRALDDDDLQLSVVGGLIKRKLLRRHLGQVSVALQAA